MTGNLTLSKFKAQEFDSISGLLCDLFDTTRSELELLYKEIINDFDKNGWPSHVVRRDFFKSQHQDFQKIYETSPSIAIGHLEKYKSC